MFDSLLYTSIDPRYQKHATYFSGLHAPCIGSSSEQESISGELLGESSKSSGIVCLNVFPWTANPRHDVLLSKRFLCLDMTHLFLDALLAP